MEANGKLQRSNNKCLWPECLVEAAARDVKDFKRFRGFKAGKRAMEANRGLQRSKNTCLWPECLVEAAARDFKHFKLRVLEILRLANGRLERPNNRGLWRQTTGCNALTTNACGRSA